MNAKKKDIMDSHASNNILHVESQLKDKGFSYPIHIGESLLDNAELFKTSLNNASGVIIISDETVMPLFGKDLERNLSEIGVNILTKCILPSGEKAKSYAELEKTLARCLDAQMDRQTMIIALGGGVVGDHAGFAAAILMRGLRFIQIPTTLLGMVDSSVGGKTGINMPQGKNLVGAFHQPDAVLIDLSVLQSLSEREFWAGYAEVIKYALINDAKFFTYLNDHIEQIKKRDLNVLNVIVKACCKNKADIVAIDEKEHGVRALLNLGHTFGHALEAENNYAPSLLHGEAVAIGCILAFEFSAELGLCDISQVSDVKEHLKAVGLPTQIKDVPSLQGLTAERMVSHMYKDKKVSHGALRLILAKGIGQSFIADDVADKKLMAFFLAKLNN
jgi:3-dehydroquinate synthase